jgi:cell division septation protein DedD
MSDERPRGLHLSDKQLVFTFMSATAFLVFAFLCGVLVGRGVKTARGPLNDPSSIAAEQVVADGSPADAPVADGVTPPAPGSRSAAPAAGSAGFTYPDRLGANPPAERLKVPPAVKEITPHDTLPPPPPDVPEEPVAKSDAGSAPGPSAAVTPRPAPVTAKPAAGASAARAGSTAPGDFTVQVAAVKSRGEAEVIVKQLKSKGYDAFVFVPGGRDELGVFRVRIGSFTDRRKADALAQRLLREEKRYRPWVTR